MGEDILSIVFLALIFIVISGIVYRLTPSNLMMPTFALMAVCLWIAYDYITLKRYQMKEKCNKNKLSENQDSDIEAKIRELSNDIHTGSEDISGVDVDVDVSVDNTLNTDFDLEPKAKNKCEFDIAMYHDTDIKEMHKEMGCTGDNKLANRMKYMGMQSKLSADNRSRMNRYTLLPYFEEELKENEDRDWWDAENDWMDELM